MSEAEIATLRRRIVDLETALYGARRLDGAVPFPDGYSISLVHSLTSLILESRQDCVAMLDLDGRTVFVSPGGIAAMEIDDVRTVLGLSWLRLWRGFDIAAGHTALAEAKASGTGRVQGASPTHAGRPKWWDVTISAILGSDGAPAHLVAIGRDITETTLAKQRLRDSEANIKLVTDALPVLISYIDADGIYRFANSFYKTWFGREPRDVIGHPLSDIVGADLYESRRRYIERALAGEHVRFEGVQMTPNGERVEDMQYIPIQKADGSLNGFYVLGFDVTDRRRAEDESRRLAALVEQSADFIGVARPDGAVEFVNEAGRRLMGLPDLQAARALPMLDYFSPDDRAFVAETVIPAVREQGFWAGETNLRNVTTGALTPIFYNVFPVRNADGIVFGYGTISRDLTEQKKAQAMQLALIELADRLRETGDPAAIIFAASEILGRTLGVSRAGYGRIDRVRETVTIPVDRTAPGIASIAGILHFREYGSYIEDLKAGIPVVIADVETDSRTMATAARLSAISARSFINFPIRDKGEFAAIFFVNHEAPRVWAPEEVSFLDKVADRTQAAVARLDAENELRSLAASLEAQVAARTRERDRMWRTSQDLFVICDGEGHYRSVNPAWTETLGFAVTDLVGMRFDALVHPDDMDAVHVAIRRLTQGAVIRDFDIRMRAKDGAYRWFNWHCIPDHEEFYAAGRDITVRKELEEQLRQAQKMEAVGQLTGGIAHDFNNLLTGIVGSLDLMQTRIRQGRIDTLDRYISGAMTSANRAAALTHRLLAFSRRQPLDPKAVNVNALVASFEDLLRRTMGETTVIEIVCAGGLWLTLCDPNQLESAILNLAINARDAMPNGGKLTIETGNVHLDRAYAAQHPEIKPGQYVSVSVTDTGTGMPPEIVARAFEPFFTTKPLGQGTGLGLSMIYGFARQSEGQAAIYSELGVGTTFKLYLPRYRGGAASSDAVVGQINQPRARQGETILVVEDEAIVRSLVVEMLIERGYQTLQASDGRAGLEILKSAKAIDLLVTDIGLPGLNGRQLVEQARAARPGLKVLFITGYAENAVFGNGYLDDGMEMITKPFAIDQLALRVRDIIRG